ncbi:MAG: riboflavin synthase [Bryobacterales bacterium]|nr:riboflavin synthase [Bryobacteraceae bacterium]MDW8128985.1 riboflavin synthase [Bryobacterales bacterium]
MFTGIVEETGQVESLELRSSGARLRVRCSRVLEDAREGSSIAVNGVCLTAVELGANGFAADVSAETLRRSNLGELRPGALVNLERPLAASGRFGGHIVQGHVDATGELVSLEPHPAGHWWLRVRFPPGLARYIAEKGSIAVDGISLTIAAVEGSIFAAAIVPHTWRSTNLRARRPGERVNLEADILAKYLESLLRQGRGGAGLTEDKLRQLGY